MTPIPDETGKPVENEPLWLQVKSWPHKTNQPTKMRSEAKIGLMEKI